MEIDVTPILLEDCALLSGSRAELGDNAGQITWRNSMALADRLPLVTNANRDGIRDHFAEYGAWEREEIDAWTDTELSAMVWQEAAASMREFEEYCGGSLVTYEEEQERGSISGRLYFVNDDGEPSAAYLYLGL